MTSFISWRIFIYVWKSFDFCYLGNGSWSIWSKTCDNSWLNCTVSTHWDLFSYKLLLINEFQIVECKSHIHFSVSCSAWWLFQDYFQHALWPQHKCLDGTFYKVSSWKFLWYTWPNEGTPLAYIRVLSKINMNCCVYVLRAWIYSMYCKESMFEESHCLPSRKDSALFRRLELGLMLGRFAWIISADAQFVDLLAFEIWYKSANFVVMRFMTHHRTNQSTVTPMWWN